MRNMIWIGLLCILAGLRVTAEEKPYAWPALPEAAVIQKTMALKSQTGLMILDRRCELTIKTFEGVRREEFLRFLVLNEEGVRAASIEVNDKQKARVESIQARTVAPGGSVTEADRTKDIHTTDLGVFKEKDPLVSVARVNFPAPVPGALLDLRFVTVYEGLTLFYADPVTFGEHPSLTSDFKIRVEGGFPGTQWSVTLLGGRAGMGTLDRKTLNEITAHFGPLVPGREEPSSLPFYQRETTLLVYLKWEFYDNSDSLAKVGYRFDVDAHGRPLNFTWIGAPMKGWWLKYAKESEEAVDQFLKRPGRAKDIPVDSLAPASMPLEERLRNLYRCAQEKAGYNPDAKNLESLADVMREGQNSSWQGTLLFGYLLERAGIPHFHIQVANRWSVRFSPIITNSYVYAVAEAVAVEVPGKGRMFFMPGFLSAPFGSLPEGYQDSIAFWPVGGKDLASCFTPLNPPGADRVEYRYQGAIAVDGSLSGKITVAKWGVPASEFVEWQREREFRRAHPKREDKKKALSAEEQTTEMDKRTREEVSLPGTRLDLTDFALAALPSSSEGPLQITCTFTGKAAAQPAQGGNRLIGAVPLMAGYVSPFTAERRETPIWFEDPGRIVMDGILTLPSGAKVVDTPAKWQFAGPEGATIAFEALGGQESGEPAVKAHLQFDRPLTVGTDDYPIWRAYESGLVSRGESRCLVLWPEGKVLE